MRFLRGVGGFVLFMVGVPVLVTVMLPLLGGALLHELLRWLFGLPNMKLGQLRSEGKGVLMGVALVVASGLQLLAWLAFFAVGSLLIVGLGWVVLRVLSWVFP